MFIIKKKYKPSHPPPKKTKTNKQTKKQWLLLCKSAFIIEKDEYEYPPAPEVPLRPSSL